MIQSEVGKAEGKPSQGLGNRKHGRQKHYSDHSAFPLPSIPTGRQSTTSWTRQRSPQRMAVVGDGSGEVSSVPDRRGRRKRRCGSDPYHTRASRRPIRVAGRFTPDGSLQTEEGRPAPQELSGRCPDLPSSLSGDDPVVGPHAGGGGNELALCPTPSPTSPISSRSDRDFRRGRGRDLCSPLPQPVLQLTERYCKYGHAQGEHSVFKRGGKVGDLFQAAIVAKTHE